MRKNKYPSFIFVFIILGFLALPFEISENLRSRTVSLFTPFWEKLVETKVFLRAPMQYFSMNGTTDDLGLGDHEVNRLLLENQLLGNELNQLKEVLEQEYFLLHTLLDEISLSHLSPTTLTKHRQEVLDLFDLELSYITARVIFRPINTWNSSFWINKGDKENQRLGRRIIAKNSPVVVGISIVGVVDFVGENQSRIRLITDSELNPSVRAKRGLRYLAKGELIGESQPLWRSHQSLLAGVGFNYDYSDNEGPARDLRTGEISDSSKKHLTMPIVQINDLLVTTGMDGIFPSGLCAGIIKKIFPLKEGDISYKLVAESSVGNLNSLNVVFILPPQQHDQN